MDKQRLQSESKDHRRSMAFQKQEDELGQQDAMLNALVDAIGSDTARSFPPV